MTDLEISKALALAIGWTEQQLEVTPFAVKCIVESWWTQPFDYRAWSVIGPIAERYECFPQFHDLRNSWSSVVGDVRVWEATPQKAIALAVIGAKK